MDPFPEKSRPLPDWVHELVPLERPLAVFDLETTGTVPHQDRIVEIAIVKVEPDGRSETRTRRLNPGMPIPPEASAVHGIFDADVAHEPTFRQLAADLAEFLAGCDLAGFNVVKFDLPLLRHEFERAGIPFNMGGRRVVDAKTIFVRQEPRDLSAAHQLYCGETFENAHSAEADALATYRVLVGQLLHYDDLPHSMDGLHRLCNPDEGVDADGRLRWRGGEAVFAFGRHRGLTLHAVSVADRDYLQWVMEGDFTPEFKDIVAAALQGRFLQRAGWSPGEAAALSPSPTGSLQKQLPFPPPVPPRQDPGGTGESTPEPGPLGGARE